MFEKTRLPVNWLARLAPPPVLLGLESGRRIGADGQSRRGKVNRREGEPPVELQLLLWNTVVVGHSPAEAGGELESRTAELVVHLGLPTGKPCRRQVVVDRVEVAVVAFVDFEQVCERARFKNPDRVQVRACTRTRPHGARAVADVGGGLGRRWRDKKTAWGEALLCAQTSHRVKRCQNERGTCREKAMSLHSG